MKKVLFLCLILSCTVTLPGQVTDRGNFLIGTALGFGMSDSKVTLDDGSGESEGEGPAAMQINVAPSIGYFLVNNVVLGIRMDYSHSRLEEPQKETTTDSDLLFGPFSRVYFPFGEDMAVLLEGGFGFGNSSDQTEVQGQPQSITTNIFSVGVGPGFTIVSSQSIGLEALFKYNYNRSQFDTEIAGISQKTTTRTNQFSISLGIQLYLSRFAQSDTNSAEPEPTRRYY